MFGVFNLTDSHLNPLNINYLKSEIWKTSEMATDGI